MGMDLDLLVSKLATTNFYPALFEMHLAIRQFQQTGSLLRCRSLSGA